MTGREPLHDESTDAARALPVSLRDAKLVAAALTPPGAWAANIGVTYALVPVAAHAGSKAVLWVVTAATTILVVTAASVAYGELRRARENESTVGSRIRPLAVTACALAAFFFLAIVAQAIPTLVIGLESK